MKPLPPFSQDFEIDYERLPCKIEDALRKHGLDIPITFDVNESAKTFEKRILDAAKKVGMHVTVERLIAERKLRVMLLPEIEVKPISLSRIVEATRPIDPLRQNINAIRDAQKTMTDEQRKELWETIQEDYCPHCGSFTNGGACYCIDIPGDDN